MKTPNTRNLKLIAGVIALAVLLLLPALCMPEFAAKYLAAVFSLGGFGLAMVAHAQPGQRAGVTIAPRDILLSYQAVRYGNGVIDAANAYDGANTSYEDELRPGTIMAQITATGLWVPCKRTVVAETGTVTALVVTDARAFKAGEVISVGADTSLTISAIDYATNTLTIASTAVVAGEAVLCTSIAGSDVARGILNEFVKLKDEDGTSRNKSFGQMVIAGLVNGSLCLGDYAAIRAASGMYLNGIQWGDQQGQV